jgi:hypothetical protein
MFVGCFAFPSNPLGKGMIQFNGAWLWAVGHAAAFIPALLRIKDNRRFAFITVGDEKICHANMNAHIAPVAHGRINYHGIRRGITVGKRVSLCFGHSFSPFLPAQQCFS